MISCMHTIEALIDMLYDQLCVHIHSPWCPLTLLVHKGARKRHEYSYSGKRVKENNACHMTRQSHAQQRRE